MATNAKPSRCEALTPADLDKLREARDTLLRLNSQIDHAPHRDSLETQFARHRVIRAITELLQEEVK